MSDFNESIQVEELDNENVEVEIPEEVKKETTQGASLIDVVEDHKVEELAKNINEELCGECDNSKKNSTVMISAI